MPAATNNRVEIDFSVYNPFDPDWVADPWDVIDRLINQYPVAFHTDLNAWLVAPHDLASEVFRSAKFSVQSSDWKDAPPPTPREEWTLRDEVQQVAFNNISPGEHQRFRRLTAPAFSRRVMDDIEARIRSSIVAIFDEIENPAEFDVATEIAEKVPVRTIARMVGVPEDKDELFTDGLAWNTVRAQSPMYAAEREKYIEGLLPALTHLRDFISERRAADEPGDDFIGTLLTTESNGEQLTDIEILSLINGLVVAGADTAVDLHSYAILGLLTHPDQWDLLRERPELYEQAVVEILRWASHGKFGALPRHPLEDVEIGGQVLEKGSLVMPLLGTAWSDPAKWDEPRSLDILRDHSGNLVFGAGPHMCIGLNLVKVQGKLMLEEFDRRFGDRARIASGPEYDPMHFNARRISSLIVRTD